MANITKWRIFESQKRLKVIQCKYSYLKILHLGINVLAVHLVELPFCEPGNVWSSKVFWLNHIDYVSLNSNPWDGNAPSLGNSWEPRKSKMAAVILKKLQNVFIFTLHHTRNITYVCTRML